MKRESPDQDGSTDKIFAFDLDELKKYEAAVRADEAAKSKAEIERLQVRANNALGVMEARCRAYEDLEQEHIDLRAKADALRDAAGAVLGRLCDHMRGITYNEAGTEKIAGEIDAFNATCKAYNAAAPTPEPEDDPLAGIPEAESIADSGEAPLRTITFPFDENWAREVENYRHFWHVVESKAHAKLAGEPKLKRGELRRAQRAYENASASIGWKIVSQLRKLGIEVD